MKTVHCRIAQAMALALLFFVTLFPALVRAQDMGGQETEGPAAFFAADKLRFPARMAARHPFSRSRVRRSRLPRDRVHTRSGALANRAVIAAAAARHGVPVRLALATAQVESRGNCHARGRAGELGPLQIKPATARGLGFRGPVAALRSCGAGLQWGMRHLALAYRACGHAGPHNYGLGGGCRRTAYARRVAALSRRY